MSKTKNTKTQTARGLDRLKEVTKGLRLQVPKIRALPNLDTEDIRSTIKQKTEACHQIQEDVANALKFLADVRSLIEEQSDRTAKKIVEAETAESAKEMQEYLNDVLDLEDPIYCQHSALAYIKSVLSQKFTDYDQAQEVLHDLCQRGLLVQTGREGPILIGYQRYAIDSKFGFETEDIEEISDAVAKFSKCLMTLVRQQRQEKKREAEEDVDIELGDAITGENGKCLAEVPAESYEDRDGNPAWRGGGSLLVNFTDKEVIPILGIGSIENAIKGMVASNVSLARYTLDWDSPPGHGRRAFERVRAGVMETAGLNATEAEAYVNKMKALWWLLQRAINALKEKEKIERLKEEFQEKAEISAEQFFGLNGSTTSAQGTAFLSFEGAFHQKGNDPSVYNLFFLATRGEENGVETVEIKDVPEHVQKFIGGFRGKKFPAENNFSGCPAQLGRVLRGIRSQMDLAHEIAKD
jgi:hypothetical protein